MNFWSDLVDEVNDRNIDKSKIPGSSKKKPVITEEMAEEILAASSSEQKAEAEYTAPIQEESDDPDFPDHPDYIALKPQWTERELWRMPAIRFYLTILCFCAGMILFGIFNSVSGMNLPRGTVGWWQIFGGAIGFLGSREIIEPRMRIPFSAGTYEQKKEATERYLAEIKEMDKMLDELSKK